MVITETWFSYQNNKTMIHNIPGFNVETVSRTDMRGGGVAIYIRKRFKYRHVELDNSHDLMTVSLNLWINNHWIKLSGIYRAPRYDINPLLDKIEEILDNDINCIIMGDNNINIRANNNQTDTVLSLIDSFGARIVNNQTTRPSSGSVIDHIISKGVNFNAIHTVQTDLSDHCMIFATLNVYESYEKRQIITRKQTDYEKLLDIIDFSSCSGIEDPDMLLECITTQINHAVQLSTMTRTFSIKSHEKIAEWCTHAILDKMTYRNNLANKIRDLKRNSLPSNKLRDKYLKADEQVKKLSAVAYTNHLTNVFMKGNRASQWTEINRILGKSRQRNPLIVCDESGNIESDINSANIVNNHLVEISTAPINSECLLENYNKYSTVRANNISMFMHPVDQCQVLRMLSETKTNKAIGHDGISGIIIKRLAPFLAEPLTELINLIIAQGKYPDELKKANVTLVPKPGFNGNINDLRPISVLPELNKIIEKILLQPIKNFLEESGYTDEKQFGFRKDSGTDLAIIELFNEISHALAGKMIIGLVFFDISKAFDMLSHQVLFKKLETYGIRGIVLKLIMSYFHGRTQAVNFNGTLSDYRTVSRGIGQGTPSGPSYFIIKLDDFKNLPLFGKSSRFADDICNYSIGRACDIQLILSNMKHDIELIEDFHKINGMTLNRKKTKFMFITDKNTPLDELAISKFADDIGIERTFTHIYLGVPIHNQFSINPRIRQLTKKISPMVGILSRLKWNLPTDVLLRIYFAHVHSHLSDTPQILSVATEIDLNSLQVLQNRALKHVFKLSPRCPTIELFRDFSKTILPVRGIIRFATCSFIHKIMLGTIKSDLKIQKSLKGLRNDGDLIPATSSRSSFINKTITCLGVAQYNKIPTDIRNTSSLDSFKRQLKINLLSSLENLL